MAIGDSRLIVLNRLDRYVRHQRGYVAPSKLELPPERRVDTLAKRVERVAKLVAVPFVPRDWVGCGVARSYDARLLGVAG